MGTGVDREKEKIGLMAILLAGSCFLTYYFHAVLETGTVFTHFFYIPIIIASLWWKRKGLAVALFLAVFLIFSHHFFGDYVLSADDYLRFLMFVVIGFVVALLSSRIAEAQGKTAHPNSVLRAIRNVSKLISKEKDRDSLLQGICRSLIETGGYYNAWIALLDKSGGLVTAAEAGLGNDFLPLVERLRRGEFVNCYRSAALQSDVVVTKDPSSKCAGCPLLGMYDGRGAMTVRLEYGGKVYGLLCSSIPTDFVGEEEQALFEEVAVDIAFALYSLELEEERERAEEALRMAAALETLSTVLENFISDSLSNLLTPIYGRIQLCKGIESIEEIKSELGDIKAGITKLLTGIRAYRKFAKAEEGSLGRISSVDIGSILGPLLS